MSGGDSSKRNPTREWICESYTSYGTWRCCKSLHCIHARIHCRLPISVKLLYSYSDQRPKWTQQIEDRHSVSEHPLPWQNIHAQFVFIWMFYSYTACTHYSIVLYPFCIYTLCNLHFHVSRAHSICHCICICWAVKE